jgi:hypothetical protein
MAPGILPALISPSTKPWIGANFAIDSSAPGGGPKSPAAAGAEAIGITAVIANKPNEMREGAGRVNICSFGSDRRDGSTLLHCVRPIQIADVGELASPSFLTNTD